MNKLLFLLASISISCYSTTSQLVDGGGGINIPNMLENINPANFLNGGVTNIPIPNLFANNNPAQLLNGGGGISNIPIPNIFGNNKPAQQISGGGSVSNIPIPNIFGNNNPAQQTSGGGGSSNIPIPNIFGNNNPAQQTSGGGGSSNIPIPNMFGNNNPAQQINGGGSVSNIPIPNIFGNNKPPQQISGGGSISNIPIPNIFGNNNPAQQINGGGGFNVPAPNVIINNNSTSSLPSLNLPGVDYQRLSALLVEMQSLMNSVVQQLQQQQFQNVPELNAQGGIIVVLLLQVREMLQNELQTLLCSGQTSVVISMEIQITTLLGQVNTALTLTAQQFPQNSNQAVPVRSVLSLIEVGQISSAPSMLNYIYSLLAKGQ